MKDSPEEQLERIKAACLKRFHKYTYLLPEHDRDGLELYLTDGILPGGFLTSVLDNNLKEAADRADYINKAHLANIAGFMIYGMPQGAQGSPEIRQRWSEHQGMRGWKNIEANDEAEIDDT